MAKLRLSLLRIVPVVAIALACGLCPGLASAAQLEAGQAGAQDQALAPQVATKTVYVVTSAVETSNFGGREYKTTLKFTYNKKGLVTKNAISSKADGNYATTYTYSGTTLKKAKQKRAKSNAFEVKYTTNKKGQFIKAVEVINQSGGGKLTRTYTVKYKSGKVKTIDRKNVFEMEGQSPSTTNDKYSYTYKNGRPVVRNMNGYKATYGYDNQGNLYDIGGSTRTNKYNAKKLLTKITQEAKAAGYTYSKTFKYKKTKVDASVADKVQAQQWAIINANLNFAFGVEGVN